MLIHSAKWTSFSTAHDYDFCVFIRGHAASSSAHFRMSHRMSRTDPRVSSRVLCPEVVVCGRRYSLAYGGLLIPSHIRVVDLDSRAEFGLSGSNTGTFTQTYHLLRGIVTRRIPAKRIFDEAVPIFDASRESIDRVVSDDLARGIFLSLSLSMKMYCWTGSAQSKGGGG